MDIPSVQSFIKKIDDIEVEVEFLTDNKSREQESVLEIKDVGVNAQTLSYIEMSLQEAISLSLPNGETIMVVKPEAWVFHKGLTFTRRTAEAKKYKDLYGIWFVLTQLGNTSQVVQKRLSKLMTQGHESWAKTFKLNLTFWVNNATPKDWDLLQKQDINGILTKENFLAVLKGFLHPSAS